MRFGLLAAGVAVCALSVPAGAAVITRTIDIQSSDFVLLSGTGTRAPIDPLGINFTVTFDNATSFNFGPFSGITVNSITTPVGTITYSYNAENDFLLVGTLPTTSGCAYDTRTYCFGVSSFSTAPSVIATKQITTDGSTWQARTNVLTVAGVPEPATWAMMIGGFGAIGSTMRRRRVRVSFG